jgi:hypothetical protein
MVYIKEERVVGNVFILVCDSNGKWLRNGLYVFYKHLNSIKYNLRLYNVLLPFFHSCSTFVLQKGARLHIKRWPLE